MDDMDDETQWVDEPGASNSARVLDNDDLNDVDNEGSGPDDDDDGEHSDDEEDDEGLGADLGAGAGMTYSRLARLAGEGGMHLDEATAAALFGGDFRSFGGMMSGLSNRFKRLKNQLRSKSSATRLAALRECSELLLVSNEDTLGGAFHTTSFATEFIAILKGQPNIDEKADDQDQPPRKSTALDDDAQLAAALAMSTGGSAGAGMGMAEEDEMECQLMACRCLAHLMEALPGSGHTLVHLGAVPVLCSKLTEISYIELAEQTLSVSEGDF
jgi:E3 ubiquitin-protein ligase TRIP12